MTKRSTSLVLAGALALAVPATVAAAPMTTAPVAERVVRESATAPTPAPAPSADGYAAREQADKDVSQYAGGSTFVITMSGTTLAILILLLLIL